MKMELNMYDLQAIEAMKTDTRRKAELYRLDVAKQLGQRATAELLDEMYDNYYAEVLSEYIADTFPEMGDEAIASLVQDAVAALRPPED